MKLSNTIVLVAVSCILVTSSCVTRKKLTYLQYSGKYGNTENISDDAKISVTPAAYKLMPNDNLFIRVITPDPQWSALFNMQTGEGGITMESAALSSYQVDIEGNIEIPYVSKVKVAGKTLNEIKEELETTFKNYVADAAITVRMVDNNVSILGEVNIPGRYPITKDRMTIFEALSMAGDMSVYSNRQKVQLIRPTTYGPVIKEFSLLDRSILSSEYYYVLPNDVIYVVPLQGKSFLTNSTLYTLFFTTITTGLVVLSYFRTL